MEMDLIQNGQATGSVAALLIKNNMNPACLRPYVDANGRGVITLNAGQPNQTHLVNNDAVLRYDEWKLLDREIARVALPRMRLFNELRASASYNLPNGMAHTVLQHQTQSQAGNATVSMDAAREADSDRPLYDITNLPLPIIHSDFFFTAREIAVSRNLGAGLDMTMIEESTERIAEQIERTTLGTAATFTYGGGTIYGYTNYPKRQTKVLTAPTAGGWTPETTRNEVTEMMKLSVDQNYFGPWRCYYSPGFMTAMMKRYSTYESKSLEQVIRELPGIESIGMADYMTGNSILLVQMSQKVARAVIGMPLTPVQWSSGGGTKIHFKLMTIAVPQLRCDYNDQTGIVHGASA